MMWDGWNAHDSDMDVTAIAVGMIVFLIGAAALITSLVLACAWWLS